MNRKYTRQQFMSTVERFVAKDSDFTFTTDVIVGFPGETESCFDNTISVIREVQFAKVHMFPYSLRPKTRAARFPDHVDVQVVKKRKQRLLQIADESAFALRERYLLRKMTILVENKVQSNIILNFRKYENIIPGQSLSLLKYIDIIKLLYRFYN